jgi:hypothetical protein
VECNSKREIRHTRLISLLSLVVNHALAAATAMSSTAAVSGKSVFIPRFMTGVTYVASAVARLVSMEVVEALRPAVRQRSSVTVMRIKAVVDVTVKTVRTVEPRACSKKHPANKPIRPVIAVRSTVIRGVIVVPVWAHGSWSDVYADRNLGRRHRGAT